MRTNRLAGLAVGLLAGAGLACTEATTNACGDGEAVRVDGSDYCVYRESVVIVGGFDCPASLPFRIDFEHATVCGEHGFDGVDVPEDICARAFVPCTEPEPDGGWDCEFPFEDCNGVSADSCETPLNTLTDCGACGAACSIPNASSRCDDGQCTFGACSAGFGNCDGNLANGCETALNTLSHCGGCNTLCTGGSATCDTGICQSALPGRSDCSSGTLYSSVAECQATARTCFTLPNGDTCGVCTGTLDCTNIDCSGYSAPTLPPPECAEGFGVWEGVCGSVRYRVVSGGYGGPTLYWDNASGELLAAKLSNDILSYCDDTAFSMVQGDALVPAACDIVLDPSTSLCPQ